MQSTKLFIGSTLMLGVMQFSASAAAITGTFNMTGTVTVAPTTIKWNSDLGPGFLADTFTLSAGAGSFILENGQNGVADLNIASEPVGSAFAPVTFITFNVVPGLPNLMIDYIYPGTASSAACGSAPAVGQQCTPPNPGGSPFTFTNNNPPNNIQSAAQWVFTGVTSDGLSSWRGDFTSQFNSPFQTVLAAFAPGGSQSVSNSYSATITVEANSSVPEPGSLTMIGIGLGLVGLAVTQRRKSRA